MAESINVVKVTAKSLKLGRRGICAALIKTFSFLIIQNFTGLCAVENEPIQPENLITFMHI